MFPVGVDIDDVLAAFNEAFLPCYNARNRTSHRIEDLTTYNYAHSLGGELTHYLAEIETFYRTEQFYHLAPVPHAQEGIQHLRSLGYTLYAITGRPDWLESVTGEWLMRHFGNSFSKLVCTNHFNEKKVRKSVVGKELGIDCMIDDVYEHAEDCAREDIRVLLLDRPWNRRDIKERLPHAFPLIRNNIKPLHDWQAVIKYVRRI